MNFLLALLFLMPDSLPARDTIPPQRIDTLREVEVKPDTSVQQMMEAIARSLGRQVVKAPPSLGDILEKVSPGINDKITHPFAFKQRKRERRRKRTVKALEQYDRVKTFDDLLREAIEREGLTMPEKK